MCFIIEDERFLLRVMAELQLVIPQFLLEEVDLFCFDQFIVIFEAFDNKHLVKTRYCCHLF